MRGWTKWMMGVGLAGALGLAARGQGTMRMASPRGRVTVRVMAASMQYAVSFHGQPVLVDAALGLQFGGQAPLGAMRATEMRQRKVDRTWRPVWGKAAEIVDRYTEGTMDLEEVGAAHRRLSVTVRAYDDGVAFRYSIPAQAGMDEFVVEREMTSFRFAGDPTVWAGETKSFEHAYEQEYPRARLSALKGGTHVVLPLLAEVGGVYAAVTEAAVTDWAGMYLDPAGDREMRVELSPRHDGRGLVVGKVPAETPWRVVMLGARAGDLIESEMIENLSPLSKIADTSWIRPGMMAWDHWWSGDVRMDNTTIERYIAFASEMGFPYQLIDWQWYGPYNKPEAVITRPAAQLNMPLLLQFAKAHHVREWLWLHSGDVTRAKDAGTLDAAFGVYEGWGVAGVKIDFMNRNDQEMVRWYEEVVELAAKHHLMVDFHGAFEPTGLRVTWPNLLTREGVLGNEYNKFSNRVTPVHKLTLPFTRMLAGPMDYTPGGFLNRSPAEWKQTTPTEVMGSRAQELALFVVYWSPLTCVTDDPEHYKGQPGLEFLRQVRTVWDETKVLDGAVGEHIVMARRSGRRWFLGGMTGDAAYTVKVPLRFLGPGRYTAHVFADPKDVKASYEAVVESTLRVTAGETLELAMRPAGGAAVWIEPVD